MLFLFHTIGEFSCLTGPKVELLLLCLVVSQTAVFVLRRGIQEPHGSAESYAHLIVKLLAFQLLSAPSSHQIHEQRQERQERFRE